LRSVSQAATEWSDLCRGTTDQMFTDTRTLLIEGLKLAHTTWERGSSAYGWCADRFDQFVLHQVSRVHTEQLCGTLGIDTDRCHKIYPEWGNVGPAGVPLTLSMAIEEGKIKPGDRVGLLGIGSGLNCTMGELVW
jgi:3-oxoacyl-[acyl-carrier-protein] synthase-3